MKNPEALVFQLRQHVNAMPDLETRPLKPESVAWLAQGSVLVEQVFQGEIATDPVFYVAEMDLLAQQPKHPPGRLINILHRALARAEAAAPMPRGGFITKGAAFDAYQVIGQVIARTKTDLLIVDPYMDERVLTHYAQQAPRGVTVRLLYDREYTKPDALIPGVMRWTKQFGSERPLEVRQSKRKSLHDRDLVIDGTRVWYMTQSLKDFADRSHGSIGEVDSEQAAMKIATYDLLWSEATKLEPSAT